MQHGTMFQEILHQLMEADEVKVKYEHPNEHEVYDSEVPVPKNVPFSNVNLIDKTEITIEDTKLIYPIETTDRCTSKKTYGCNVCSKIFRWKANLQKLYVTSVRGRSNQFTILSSTWQAGTRTKNSLNAAYARKNSNRRVK